MSKSTWLQPATWLTFFAWGAVAACAVYWGLRLQSAGSAGAVAAAATVPAALTPQQSAMAKVLGAKPAVAVADGAAPESEPAPASGRFALQGVLAQGRGGVALIAIDGQAAKHFRVGAEIEPGWVLLSVAKRSAQLGPSRGAPASVKLELPASTVMVSSSASPALAARPPAPGTPAIATAPFNSFARPAAAPEANRQAVQVPGLGTPEGTTPEAQAQRAIARRAGLRTLRQGSGSGAAAEAAAAAAGTAPAEQPNAADGASAN